MKVRLLKAEFNTAVKYVTKEGFTNNFPITFDLEGINTLLVVVGFKVQKGTYTVETVEGMPCVVFKEDLKEGTEVTIQRRTHGEVPHTYQYTGNAQGGSEFNAATIDENFDHLYRVVEEVNEGFELNLDGLHRLEDKFNDVTDGFEEVKEIAKGADAKSESAIKTANRADTKADGAVATATQALDTAKAADSKSDQAITVSDDAIRIANEAKVQAANAEETSEEAVVIAEGASETAGIALNQSNAAIADAKHAVEVAEGVDSKAEAAVSTANEAKGIANTALSTATDAKETAEGISGIAQEALDTANKADSNASIAKDVAEGVEAKADSAIKVAGEADKKAQEALDKVGEKGITEAELISKSNGTGNWLRESNDYGLGLKSPNTSFSLNDIEQAELMRESGVRAFRNATGTKWSNMKTFSPALVVGTGTSYATFSTDFRNAEVTVTSGRQTGDEVVATLLSNRNTKADKNGVVHMGTGTPINTLNTSDMSQTVVNRDDVTVTSGAVYREAQKYIPKEMPRSEVGWAAIRAKDSTGTALNLECKDGFIKASLAVDGEGSLSLKEYVPNSPFPKSWDMPSKSGTFAIEGDMESYRGLAGTKLANTFYTGDSMTNPVLPEIFKGAKNVFQSFCIIGDRLFVVNRSDKEEGGSGGGNWLKGELYRIIEYPFTGTGTQVKPIAISRPLEIGHGSFLGYRFEGSKLYFYSGYPNDSTTDRKRGGKGFTRIEWKGDATSQADVKLHRLFAFEKESGNFSNVHSAYASLNSEGDKVVMSTGTSSDSVSVLVYDRVSAESKTTNINLNPLYVCNLKGSHGTLQGVAMHGDVIYVYRQSGSYRACIDAFDLNGNLLSNFNHFNMLEGVVDGVGSTSSIESEGLWVDSSGIYCGVRTLIHTGIPKVTYGGKTFTLIKTSTGNSPDDATYWMPTTNSGGATPYQDDITYTFSGTRVDNKKHIIALTKDYSSVNDIDSNIVNYSPTSIIRPTNKATVEYDVVSLNTGNVVRSVSFDYKDLIATTRGKPFSFNHDGSGGMLELRVSKTPVGGFYANLTATTYLTKNGNRMLFRKSRDSSLSNYSVELELEDTALTARTRSNAKGGVDLGSSAMNFKDLYLVNQPTVTSDKRAKFDIEDIDEKYMRVMSRLKFKQFKLKTGTSGRTHFGIVAQEWIAACEAEGVDPKESGVLVGNETEGYAIRYTELQILHNAYVLRRLDNMEV